MMILKKTVQEIGCGTGDYRTGGGAVQSSKSAVELPRMRITS